MAASSSSSSYARGARGERSPESFESLRKRNEAVEILQSYEKLSWHSYARRETLQQTRLHFQNIVAGFSSEDEAALVDWPTDNSPLPARDGDADRGSRRKSTNPADKGKESASVAAQNGSVASPGGKGKEKANDATKWSDSSKKKRKG
ncbi:hypothetical protein AMS68_002335 [Peltaster fructicola]|uniref:Uncharacterized protein n=1 Tax=Peltaster fructicola TaxID=286661 RepID=A0A6H0XQA3_9PEZI|nr:hypothetical protein AMS68_002335 [Peltaster fructicola]